MDFFDFDEEKVQESPFKEKLKKAKYFSIREKYDEARRLYEEILEKDYAEPDALAGLLRVDSENFEVYNKPQIEKDIKFVKKVLNKVVDREVLDYIDNYEYGIVKDNKKPNIREQLEKEKLWRLFDLDYKWSEYESAHAYIYAKIELSRLEVDIEKQLQIIRKYADCGYRNANLYLAMAYYHLEKYDLFQKHMEQEIEAKNYDAYAMFYLLTKEKKDVFKNIDFDRIFNEYLMVALEHNSAKACYVMGLAYCFSSICGFERDLKKALEFSNLAKKYGDRESYYIDYIIMKSGMSKYSLSVDDIHRSSDFLQAHYEHSYMIAYMHFYNKYIGTAY